MTTTKPNWLKRSLSLLLVFTLFMSLFTTNAFAATGNNHDVERIAPPVEDGVYYAKIDLVHASNSTQYSMGNAALRGSTTFLKNHPEDADYKALVIVRDGTATAIVEFMPMGYIGMYGCLLELDAVDAKEVIQTYIPNYKDTSYTTYIPATVLAEHLTVDGKVVYDQFNDPDSDYLNAGGDERPAGYGHTDSSSLDLEDKPYSHIMALDVTPIYFPDIEEEAPQSPKDFDWGNAAFVHVFVPIMFSISSSSGDQYAKLKVDWETLEKIDDPGSVLQYRLWEAMQIERGNYTSASYSHLQEVISTTKTALSNIWPSQQLELAGNGFTKQPVLNMVNPDEKQLLEDLNAAINGLEVIGDKTELDALILEAQSKDETLYTDETWAPFENALEAALAVQKDKEAGASAVEKAVDDLHNAMNALTYKDADYTAVQAAIQAIPDNLFSICTEETAQAVQDAVDAVDWTLDITKQNIVDQYAQAIREAIGNLVYLGADYSKVSEAIAKIPDDLTLYTDETAQAVKDARDAVDWTKNKTEQSIVDEYARAIEEAVSKLVYKPADYTAIDEALAKVPEDLSVYTDETVAALNSVINAVVRGKDMSEKDVVDGYAKAIEGAIKALEYKPADYTAVDEALKKVPSDLTLYTDESVKDLQDAIDSVDRDKNITEQAEVDAMAKAIEEAVSALSYKPADYSAVDAALASVPSDLSVYTDESVKAVQDACDAVVRGKNITEQSAVDAMAKAIENAVAGLERKAGTLDKFHLEDGVYSLYGEMIKVNRQDKSMSNDAINHTIKLTVRDGKYYLTMDFHGLSYLNRFGYLAKLSYYDNGYIYGAYGKIEGDLVAATVLSTQKNADGSDVIDEFNMAGGSSEGLLYPDQLEFPLVDDALNDPDGYVPLHVFVPVMEDISEGTGDQDVLLCLDWSTLEKTTEDDPAFQPEAPVEQSPAVDYTDAKTGVKVHADKGVFDEGVQIVVTEITAGAAYDNAASALSDVGKKFKLYDVKFFDKDGNEATPNGTVTISYPIPAGYDAQNIAAYRINEDGSKVLVKGTADNGFYTITTRTAANTALVEKDSTVADDQNGGNTENPGNPGNTGNNSTTNSPQTGDNSNLAVWFLLMLVSGAALVTMTVCRRRETFLGE